MLEREKIPTGEDVARHDPRETTNAAASPATNAGRPRDDGVAHDAGRDQRPWPADAPAVPPDAAPGITVGPLDTVPASEAGQGKTRAARGVPLPRLSRVALAGLVLSFALMVVGNSLFQTIIPLWVLHTGHSTLLIGMIQSSYYAGFIAGAMVNRLLIHRIGQHRTFIAYAAAAAILALAFGHSTSPPMYIGVRALSGFVFMGLYGSSESWLNTYAANEKRGQLFGIYSTINYLSMGIGQFLIKLANGFSVQLFALAAALFASAVMPGTLLGGSDGHAPSRAAPTTAPIRWQVRIREMLVDSPLAVPGGILTGFLYCSFYSLAPVYLVGVGFSTGELSVFMGVALIGALLPQWPMGRLSDRFDRGRLLSRIALLSGALSGALLLSSSSQMIWCAMLAYVAVTFTLYGVVISQVQDSTKPHYRLSMSITLLVLFSLGGIAGPPLASLAMTAMGPSGFFFFNLCTCLSLALCARLTTRRRTMAS